MKFSYEIITRYFSPDILPNFSLWEVMK